MSMEITFELSNADLEYFRQVMLSARKKCGDLDEKEIIGNARKLLQEVWQSDTSDFIRERVPRYGLQAKTANRYREPDRQKLQAL